jgi:16S rRNA (cytidine1402-2'-O)-methyltransferase
MAPLTPPPIAALTVPPGTLYVVATPIGNLADAAPRALETLRRADVVVCEDTRTTRTLLARHGIERPTLALHAHNERAATVKLLAELQAGKSVALVSDAGTPGVSDPGALLVEAAHRAGIRVVPVPGPSAAVAAYSAAGFAAGGFLFVGFLPPKASARRQALEALDVPWALILYEAPHRVLACVQDLRARFGSEREIVIARELTKKFEEVARLPLAAAPAWLEAGAHRQQGEFVLVLAPGAPARPDEQAAQRVLEALLEALPASEAAKLTARITGAPRNVLYKRALERGK